MVIAPAWFLGSYRISAVYEARAGAAPQTFDPPLGAAGAKRITDGSHAGCVYPGFQVNDRASEVLPKSPGVDDGAGNDDAVANGDGRTANADVGGVEVALRLHAVAAATPVNRMAQVAAMPWLCPAVVPK